MTPDEKKAEEDISGIPIIPKLPKDYDPFPHPNKTIAICGECGLHIKSVMGFFCSNQRCPTGLGGATC